MKVTGSPLQFIQVLTLQVKTYNIDRGSTLMAFKKEGEMTFVACAVGFCSTRNFIASFLEEKRQISGKGASLSKRS